MNRSPRTAQQVQQSKQAPADAAMAPESVALAYLTATHEKNWDRVAALLHPDLDFTMPGGKLNKADFLSAVSKLGPILLRNEIKRVFVDGDQVCVIYDFVTDTPVGAVPSVEWLRIEDARIRSIWLLFDRQPWPAVLEELGRRTTR